MLRQGMRAQDIAEKLFPGNAKGIRNDNIPKALIDATVSAKRLARTEAAAREDELTDIFFKENKIKYFDWVTEPGACKKCLVIGALGPYKVDDEASPRIPGSSHPNCRCRRIPTEVETDEKADRLKKALAAGIVSGISKRDDSDNHADIDDEVNETEEKPGDKLILKEGRQRIHFQGTKEYNDRVRSAETPGSKREGWYPSYFIISQDELEDFVRNNVTEENLLNNYFFMDFGKAIGVYKTKGDSDQITSRIKVLMSADRKMYHAVPAPPKDRKKE